MYLGHVIKDKNKKKKVREIGEEMAMDRMKTELEELKKVDE